MSDRELAVAQNDRNVWTAKRWKWEERRAASTYIKFTEKLDLK
jgi:hypothetical protein